MKTFCKALAPLIVIVIGIPLSYAAVTWTIIDVPGSIGTYVRKINATGQIVGTYQDSSGAFHGFLLSAGIYTSIDFPGAVNAEASGISDNGQIVGCYSLANGATHGFVWDGQTFTSIDFPGGAVIATRALGINNSGQIVGDYQDLSVHGFELSGGIYATADPPGTTYSELDGINNLGDAVGSFRESNGDFAGFVYNAGTFEELLLFPGSHFTFAADVNDRRQVVGNTEAGPSSPYRGFAFLDGTYLRVTYSGGRQIAAWGINIDGAIVGDFVDSSGRSHGFLRIHGTGSEKPRTGPNMVGAKSR